MTTDQTIFIAAARVRQALVEPGDIRGEVEFQNDINGLLARIDDGVTLEAATAPAQSAPAPSVRGLRIIQGGVGHAHTTAQPPPFRQSLARTG